MQFIITTLLAFAALASAAALPSPYDYENPSGLPTCIPYPGQNLCDITTSCINTEPNGELHCACRAGYKGDNVADSDTSQQARLQFIGQEYRVFVAPGVVCNTLCDSPHPGPSSCQEVVQI
ncbi:hypothetical protein EDC01DRAFT_652966 [Geopyxis carbonaria]|nr:hypothetical protein EDC01DRAFT_652966 [Geopyxis carbonaria]